MLKSLFSVDKSFKWQYSAICQKGGVSQLEEFFATLTGKDRTVFAKLLVMIREFAKETKSPHLLPDDWCHQVHKKPPIWEFIKGSFRIFWFDGEGKAIVCSSSLRKKGNKADKAAVADAIKKRDEYISSKQKELAPSDIWTDMGLEKL